MTPFQRERLEVLAASDTSASWADRHTRDALIVGGYVEEIEPGPKGGMYRWRITEKGREALAGQPAERDGGKG